MIDLSIELLLDVIVVLLVFCSTIIIYLIFQERRDSQKKREMEDYAQVTKALWHKYILEDVPLEYQLIPKDKSEIAGAENILLSYLKNFSDPAIHFKICSFAQVYLKEHYKTELTGRKWSQRMNAMYRITDFQLNELVGTCEALMKNKSSSEEFQLLKLYSILEKENFIKELLAS